MIKKFVSLLLVLVLVLGNATSVLAIDANAAIAADTMTGVVTDEFGNSYEVVGYLVESAVPYSDEGTYAATYVYEIPASTTVSSPDDGYSSEVFLTVHYKVKDGRHYLLTAISGYWVIEDRRVSVIDSYIDYCGSAYLGDAVFDVPVTNNFYVETGFTRYTPDDGTFSTVGATLNLTYLMGTSRTWTFSLQNNIL